jgi:integrase
LKNVDVLLTSISDVILTGEKRWHQSSNGHGGSMVPAESAPGMPGARQVTSKIWSIQIQVDGRQKLIKGFTDRAATVQLAARMEREKAQGETGLVDPFKEHRGQKLTEHVADWIAELRQLGRDHVYVGLCDFRLRRLAADCDWRSLAHITSAAFIKWRETANVSVGTARIKGSNVKSMGARTQNHYLTTLQTFCRWVVKRKRMATNPIADVQPVTTAGRLRRERRALLPNEITALLEVVPARHQLAYRMILGTGLRRDELRQLRWSDMKLNAPAPCIELRPETTKAKRGDVLPLRRAILSSF